MNNDYGTKFAKLISSYFLFLNYIFESNNLEKEIIVVKQLYLNYEKKIFGN